MSESPKNEIRNRTKEYFPTVLLTLLSIVQAIALELLWGKIVSNESLYQIDIAALIGWMQVTATLLGIMLIWVVYAGNVMRFRWVPNVADSAYPFLVGILEFWLVECLGPGKIGFWFLAMGGTFGLMTWVSQITMRRSRFDPDNKQFFQNVVPATWRDFVPHFSIVSSQLLLGVYLVVNPPTIWLEAFLLLIILVFLTTQCVSTSRYWQASMADPAPKTEPEG